MFAQSRLEPSTRQDGALVIGYHATITLSSCSAMNNNWKWSAYPTLVRRPLVMENNEEEASAAYVRVVCV